MNRGPLVVVGQMVLGMALVALSAHFFIAWLSSERVAHLPAGRSILRPPQDVQCLALVNNTIWAGGKDGLFIFATNGSALPVPEPLRDLHFVAALLSEKDGGVWIAHEDGVSHWQRPVVRHYSVQAGAFPSRGLSVLRDRDGALWAGAERVLTRLDGSRFETVAIPESFALTEAAVLYQDRAGTLWIGDSSPRSPGLIRRDAQGFHLLSRREGLPHASINTIMEQGSNSDLWVGTGFAGSGGAVAISNGSLRAIGRQHGLAGDKVRTIFEDSRGRLWFGSEYDGVAVFGDTRLAVIGEGDGLAGPEVKAIVEYPANTFWLGTNGGLTRIEDFEPPAGDARYPGFGSLRQ